MGLPGAAPSKHVERATGPEHESRGRLKGFVVPKREENSHPNPQSPQIPTQTLEDSDLELGPLTMNPTNPFPKPPLNYKRI